MTDLRFSSITSIQVSPKYQAALRKKTVDTSLVRKAIDEAVAKYDNRGLLNPQAVTLVDTGDSFFALSQGDKADYQAYQQLSPEPEDNKNGALSSYFQAFLKSKHQPAGEIPVLYVNP